MILLLVIVYYLLEFLDVNDSLLAVIILEILV